MLDKRSNEDGGQTWIGDSWDEMGFNLKGRDNAAHDIKVLCPSCSEERKNKFDPCVSIRPLDGIANCKNCGTVFLIRKEAKEYVKSKSEAKPMRPANIVAINDAGIDYLKSRKISIEAIKATKICWNTANKRIGFPYFKDGALVNIKYRSIHEKSFSQEVGGYHIVWNYDSAKIEVGHYKKLIINEGELDTISFITAGLPFVVSLDSGSPNPEDRTTEKKFECITNSFDLIEAADVVYIAVDNDTNGKIATKELIRRIGVEKCKIVDFGKYKDANEVLMYEGKEALRGLIDTASDPKVDGIFTAKDYYHQVMDLYTNGLTKGSTTYMPSIDEGWKWRMGEVNVWTGYNNEGKSKLLRYLEMLKAKYDGWKAALFIPEDMPQAEWFEDMCHMYIGRPLDPEAPEHIRATPDQVSEAMSFLNDNFFIVYPDEAFTLDTLFDKFRYLIRKFGVRVVDIDPYNTVEHLYGKNMTTDLYISYFMGRLKRFAVENDVAVNVVFHQNPPEAKNEDGTYPPPRKYRMKGGGTISDKADNVLGVWRPRRQIDFKDPTVTFLTEKIKKQKYTGKADMQIDVEYEYNTNRYVDLKLNRTSPLAIPLAYL